MIPFLKAESLRHPALCRANGYTVNRLDAFFSDELTASTNEWKPGRFIAGCEFSSWDLLILFCCLARALFSGCPWIFYRQILTQRGQAYDEVQNNAIHRVGSYASYSLHGGAPGSSW